LQITSLPSLALSYKQKQLPRSGQQNGPSPCAYGKETDDGEERRVRGEMEGTESGRKKRGVGG